MGKKGYQAENECRKLLEDAGFLVHRKVNNQYDRGDIFGFFDLVALGSEDVKFVQVTHNSTDGKLKEIKNGFDYPGFVDVELWLKVNYEGWKVYRLVDGEWSVLVDERDSGCNMGEGVAEFLS